MPTVSYSDTSSFMEIMQNTVCTPHYRELLVEGCVAGIYAEVVTAKAD